MCNELDVMHGLEKCVCTYRDTRMLERGAAIAESRHEFLDVATLGLIEVVCVIR